MRTFDLLTILLVSYGNFAYSAGSVLRAIEVPQYASLGSSAPISCFFDLSRRQLYSLKWYHNKTEFYRYVPKDGAEPFFVNKNNEFDVTEVFRNSWRLTLNLTRLTSGATGEYTCEIIVEYPSFSSESNSSTMTVLQDQLLPPLLEEPNVIYEPEDTIKLGCQQSRPFRGRVKPHIEWHLQRMKINDSMIIPYGELHDGTYMGSFLQLAAFDVLKANGTVFAECHLVLGNIRLKASITIRVRRGVGSYVNNGAISNCIQIDLRVISLYLMLQLL